MADTGGVNKVLRDDAFVLLSPGLSRDGTIESLGLSRKREHKTNNEGLTYLF